MDTSVRALPYHYRDVKGEDGHVIKFVFEGDTEKYWYLYFDGGWQLYTSVNQLPDSEVRIKDDYAWRIFTKGMKKEEAIAHSAMIGKQELGLKIFDMIAVTA